QGNFNFPPSVANLSTPSGLQSDDIAFTYDISDPDTLDNQNSTLRVVVEYKKTSASTWSVATVTGQVDNLSSGTGKTFTWRSRTDQDNQNTTYQVRITAYDRPVGFTGNPPMQQSGALASGSFQVDHLDPVVAVTYPNVAGILKKGGTSITITWTTTDANKDKVSIRLLDVATLPGTVIATVASGIADTVSLAYVLPVVDNSNLKIEVTAVDKRGNTGADMSDNVFQIDSTPPVVDLTYPENLDLLMTGVAYSITWTSTELNKYQARIDYNTTGDFANTASTVTLFNGITDNGSVSWTPSTSHISTTGRLRVMAWDKVSNLSSFNVGANTFEVRSTISTKTYTWTSTSDFDTFSRGAVENNYPADALTISKRFSNAFHYYGAAYAVDSLRGNSNIYVVGVYPGLLYTRDGGATFTRMNANSENKLPNSAVSAVSFLHDGVGDTFLAGGSSSGLCLTRDRGATWTVWTTATKPGIPSNSVRAVDFYDRDTSGRTFIVATSAGAAVTYDGGQTFTWYTSPTIPSSDVYDVEFYSGADASGPDNFLIGTTGGAARTANRGASFQSYTTATSPALDSTNWVRGVDYFEGYTSPYGSNGTRFAILTTKSGVYGARIHLENNGNTTAWEMVRRVEEVMVSSAENSYRVDFCDDDTGADTFLVATNGGLAFWRDNSSSTPTTVWTGGEWGSNSVYDVKFRSGKGFTETGEWMATTGAGCRKTTNAGSSNFDAIGAAQRIHSNDVRSVSIYSGGGAPGTTILIGTYGQGAYWSSDGGATLTRIIGNLPGNEALSCDIWDGGNQGRTVAIGTKDGLFTTQQANQGDAGSKITTTSFSLGNNDVYGVKYWDRGESDSKLVIGTEKGGYHSSDRGASMDQTFSEGNGSPQLLSEKVRGVAYFSGDATALTYAFATIFNPNGFGSSDDRDGGINYTNNDGAQFTKWGTANGVPHRDVFSVDMLDVTGGGVHILSATTGGVFVTHDFNVTRKTFAANYATAVFSSDDLLGSTWFYGGASGTGLTINDGASFYPVNGGTNPPMNGTATSIECQKGTANSTFIIGSSGGAYLGPVRYVGTGVFRVMRADPMVLIPTGGTFLKWRSLSYNGTVPASTAVKYQFYKSDGTLVPDSAIAGNSTGITLAPAAKIDLTLLTAASYPTLTIVGVMTTSVSNGTPTVNDITLELDFQN
ncbi:MAG: hypothetical protein HY719_06660, partial [Planctomycetes bacterium]|nr:hypothetical protein [Planctomycetota bacterium]